ncbi:MAG: alpha/beta hydrolase [Acidimicrobiaceae bacterium]|nr:alpha/beta hydrolase [Acidimicrobiaceae bacterium]
MTSRVVAVPGGRYGIDESGDGPPLLYFHGLWEADERPLAVALARSHRVIAPSLPGFGLTEGEEHLRSVGDAVYSLLDLLDTIGFERAPVVGSCLGALFAAELAVTQPDRFPAVVLLAPFGMWDDTDPGIDAFTAAPDELTDALCGAAGGAMELAPSLLGPGAVPFDGLSGQEVIELRLARGRALAGAARFLWPIPDRGLASRAHRLPARTLVVLGGQDRICPPGPASRILGDRGGGESRLEIVNGAGHLVYEYDPPLVGAVVADFLAR